MTSDFNPFGRENADRLSKLIYDRLNADGQMNNLEAMLRSFAQNFALGDDVAETINDLTQNLARSPAFENLNRELLDTISRSAVPAGLDVEAVLEGVGEITATAEVTRGQGVGREPGSAAPLAVDPNALVTWFLAWFGAFAVADGQPDTVDTNLRNALLALLFALAQLAAQQRKD